MKVNPFTVTGAPAWLSDHSDDVIGQLDEQGIQQLARLLSRLLEVAESEPDLYRVLPWLRSTSPWELLLKRKKEARFQYVCRFPHPSRFSHSTDLSKMPKTAATLFSFFARVTQPIAEMAEALYLSPLLRDTHTVWQILRRMAQTVGVKPLPRDVVMALCASLTRNRLITLSQCRPRPHPATWKITWRSIQTRLHWPGDTTHIGRDRNPLLVLVREEITHKAGIGYQQTGKVLAVRCLPNPHGPRDLGLGAGETGEAVEAVEAGEATGKAGETSECIQAAMKLALYDALAFSRSRDGDFNQHMVVSTLLRVQTPVPRAIREAAKVWRIMVEKVEEVEEVEAETKWDWEWEKELADRVLDPVHYMRILDRRLERTCGNAPLLTKQRVTSCQGWLWNMLPDHDPLLNYVGLCELLPSFLTVVGDDGTIEWQGWHYRDYEEDTLRYFPHAQVTVRRSPLTEAVILVYWRGSVLCYAVAEELRHQDGSCRSYWFPYPRLGE